MDFIYGHKENAYGVPCARMVSRAPLVSRAPWWCPVRFPGKFVWCPVRLSKEFESYKEVRQRRMKVFRLEAVRAGFKTAWQTKDYAAIVTVANWIPEDVLQEDSKLIMWYDSAVNKMEEGK